MDCINKKQQDQARAQVFEIMKNLFNIEDTRTLENFVMIRFLANFIETLMSQRGDQEAISGPRWRLMLLLYLEEKKGKMEGLTPTTISHFQRVSKNTISSLIRGLEEQKLVQRSLDPQDYRLFRIQLTPAGRELISVIAPERIRFMNQLASCLTPEENFELHRLLKKIQDSLIASCKENNQSHGG
jgi:DNA-binding MarR family transcriptional regulator